MYLSALGFEPMSSVYLGKCASHWATVADTRLHDLRAMVGDHGGAVVTHFPPTSEFAGSKPGPYVGKLEVAYRWSAVCSTETWPTVCTGFLYPKNYPSWYDLYSVERDIKPQINKLIEQWSMVTICGHLDCRPRLEQLTAMEGWGWAVSSIWAGVKCGARPGNTQRYWNVHYICLVPGFYTAIVFTFRFNKYSFPWPLTSCSQLLNIRLRVIWLSALLSYC